MSDRDELIQKAAEALAQIDGEDSAEVLIEGGAAESFLDAVEPLLREQIAKEVEAVIDTSPWEVRLRYGLLEAIKIIRGGGGRHE